MGSVTLGLTDVCLIWHITDMHRGVILGLWSCIVTLDFSDFVYFYDVTEREGSVFKGEMLWNKYAFTQSILFIFRYSVHPSTSNNRNLELNNVQWIVPWDEDITKIVWENTSWIMVHSVWSPLTLDVPENTLQCVYVCKIYSVYIIFYSVYIIIYNI